MLHDILEELEGAEHRKCGCRRAGQAGPDEQGPSGGLYPKSSGSPLKGVKQGSNCNSTLPCILLLWRMAGPQQKASELNGALSPRSRSPAGTHR